MEKEHTCTKKCIKKCNICGNFDLCDLKHKCAKEIIKQKCSSVHSIDFCKKCARFTILNEEENSNCDSCGLEYCKGCRDMFLSKCKIPDKNCQRCKDPLHNIISILCTKCIKNSEAGLELVDKTLVCYYCSPGNYTNQKALDTFELCCLKMKRRIPKPIIKKIEYYLVTTFWRA